MEFVDTGVPQPTQPVKHSGPAPVSITDVKVLNPVAPFGEPLRFEVTFECSAPLAGLVL